VCADWPDRKAGDALAKLQQAVSDALPDIPWNMEMLAKKGVFDVKHAVDLNTWGDESTPKDGQMDSPWDIDMAEKGILAPRKPARVTLHELSEILGQKEIVPHTDATVAPGTELPATGEEADKKWLAEHVGDYSIMQEITSQKEMTPGADATVAQGHGLPVTVEEADKKWLAENKHRLQSGSGTTTGLGLLLKSPPPKPPKPMYPVADPEGQDHEEIVSHGPQM
jgi:hypothetical protein